MLDGSSIASAIFLASIPILSILATIIAVLGFDLYLYRSNRPTISDKVRDLYARFGVIVPILMISSFVAIAFLAIGACVVHFFLYMY